MITGKKSVSVQERVQEYGPKARARMRAHFLRAAVVYPPHAVTLVGLKREKMLQVYAAGADGRMRFICAYPILAASGDLGPKLREGDRQVPEGLYRVDWLNPNSAFHLSLHLTYPNRFDRQMGRREGRRRLGGEIMIHGGAASVGCLAMGDDAAEDLFILMADIGTQHNQVILSPLDFRTDYRPEDLPRAPVWVDTLYPQIEKALQQLPPPP